MNEKLEEYIAKSKADEQESRNQLLISEGLYYDVRLPENEHPTEGSVYGIDPKDNEYHYFTRHAEELTEEEYEEFLKAYKNNVKNKQYTSISGGMPGISICFYVLGFIMILAGIFVGAQLGDAGMREFNWASAIICWVAFLTGSLFLFGFGKIIALLNDIKNK